MIRVSFEMDAKFLENGFRIKYRVWVRLNPVAWKKKTHLGSGRGCVAERAVRQLQPRQSSGEAQLELVRQLQRQPRRSVLPGLPITTPCLNGRGLPYESDFDHPPSIFPIS
jgi:hypothetical protein